MDRQTFLQRIRRASQHGRKISPGQPADPPLQVDEQPVRRCGATGDLAGRFAEQAAAVGMEVVPTCRADLGAALADLLTKASVTTVVSALEDRSVCRHLEQAGIALLDWQGDRTMAACYQAGAGLTPVAAAVAETGTLVLTSDRPMGRGLPLVPPLHVAVVRRSQVVADLLDVLDGQDGQEPAMPTWMGLVTGPSKTADIEGILVTGVHGPGRVVVMLVGDD